MSLAVTGTQTLKNTTAPVTGYPITVGCWVRPAAAGNVFRSIWQLSKLTDATDRLALYQWTGSTWCTLATVSSADDTCTGGTVTALQWHYLVARFISTTNRRIDVLNASTSTAHTQSTGSAAPASLVEINIGTDTGGADAFSGQIAELWYTNTDIQPDGASLDNILLRQLAYNGPFSVPYIAKDIVEYHSFVSAFGKSDHPGEVFWGARGQQIYTVTGSPLIGQHVPLLLPSYVRPDDYQPSMVI